MGGTYRHSARLAAELNWSRNKINLPEGDFLTDLVRLRLTLAFSPKMYLQNLIQYNTDSRALTSNIRFRLIHHPLSDFFIVYNESRGISGNSDLNRALSVKFTHLFSF